MQYFKVCLVLQERFLCRNTTLVCSGNQNTFHECWDYLIKSDVCIASQTPTFHPNSSNTFTPTKPAELWYPTTQIQFHLKATKSIKVVRTCQKRHVESLPSPKSILEIPLRISCLVIGLMFQEGERELHWSCQLWEHIVRSVRLCLTLDVRGLTLTWRRVEVGRWNCHGNFSYRPARRIRSGVGGRKSTAMINTDSSDRSELHTHNLIWIYIS